MLEKVNGQWHYRGRLVSDRHTDPDMAGVMVGWAMCYAWLDSLGNRDLRVDAGRYFGEHHTAAE